MSYIPKTPLQKLVPLKAKNLDDFQYYFGKMCSLQIHFEFELCLLYTIIYHNIVLL